jgi:hypothetical protein
MAANVICQCLEKRRGFQIICVCAYFQVIWGGVVGFYMQLHLLSVSIAVSSRQFYTKAWQSNGCCQFLNCIRYMVSGGMMIVGYGLGRTWRDVVVDYSKACDVTKESMDSVYFFCDNYIYFLLCVSWDSAVSIAIGYQLDN